jgi:hypothetical protein
MLTHPVAVSFTSFKVFSLFAAALHLSHGSLKRCTRLFVMQRIWCLIYTFFFSVCLRHPLHTTISRYGAMTFGSRVYIWQISGRRCFSSSCADDFAFESQDCSRALSELVFWFDLVLESTNIWYVFWSFRKFVNSEGSTRLALYSLRGYGRN